MGNLGKLTNEQIKAAFLLNKGRVRRAIISAPVTSVLVAFGFGVLVGSPTGRAASSWVVTTLWSLI